MFENLEAIACLRSRLSLEPYGVVVRRSWPELLVLAYPSDRTVGREFFELSEGFSPKTPLHVAWMLCRAKALRRLGGRRPRGKCSRRPGGGNEVVQENSCARFVMNARLCRKVSVAWAKRARTWKDYAENPNCEEGHMGLNVR